MKSYNEKVRFIYRILARAYDLMDKILFPIKKYNPRIALARQIPNQMLSVLDVCVGTGNTAISIASRNNKNKVSGIDLSDQMLLVAENKIRKRQLSNIKLCCMDAARIGLNEEFDVVTTSLSLHEMPKDIRDAVLKQMSGILKDNGKIYIIEWDKPKNPVGSILFMFFPYLFEPKGFGDFLRLNWSDYLGQNGLKLERIERFTFTKLIIASKEV